MSNNPVYAYNQYYSEYRMSAKRRGHDFRLTKEEFYKLVKERCYLCKEVPSNKIYSSRKTHFATVNGLDRVNPNRGYVKSNVKPCCSKCNYMKRQMSVKEFKQHILKILGGFLNV